MLRLWEELLEKTVLSRVHREVYSESAKKTELSVAAECQLWGIYEGGGAENKCWMNVMLAIPALLRQNLFMCGRVESIGQKHHLQLALHPWAWPDGPGREIFQGSEFSLIGLGWSDCTDDGSFSIAS